MIVNTLQNQCNLTLGLIYLSLSKRITVDFLLYHLIHKNIVSAIKREVDHHHSTGIDNNHHSVSVESIDYKPKMKKKKFEVMINDCHSFFKFLTFESSVHIWIQTQLAHIEYPCEIEIFELTRTLERIIS